MPVSSLTSNCWYSSSVTRAVAPFLVHIVSASCRRGIARPSWWSSSRNSRRTRRMSADVKKSMKLLGSFRPRKAAKSGTEDQGVEILLVHHTVSEATILPSLIFSDLSMKKQVKNNKIKHQPLMTGKTKIRSGFMFVGNWPTSIYCMFKHWQRYPTGLALHRAAQPAGVWKARNAPCLKPGWWGNMRLLFNNDILRKCSGERQ